MFLLNQLVTIWTTFYPDAFQRADHHGLEQGTQIEPEMFFPGDPLALLLTPTGGFLIGV